MRETRIQFYVGKSRPHFKYLPAVKVIKEVYVSSLITSRKFRKNVQRTATSISRYNMYVAEKALVRVVAHAVHHVT